MDQAHTLQTSPGSVEWYLEHWGKCTIDPDHAERVSTWALKLADGKLRYQEVESRTQVPWQMIGALHGNESSFNFHTYLGNGDPLNQVTRHIPAGRGPFSTWQDGAFDALKYDGLLGRSWDIPLMLQWGEKYNGTGYLKYHPSHMSPYIWAATDLETPGRYVSDGTFNAMAISKNVGIAATFKQLIWMGLM